jgi:hypothetical protein
MSSKETLVRQAKAIVTSLQYRGGAGGSACQSGAHGSGTSGSGQPGCLLKYSWGVSDARSKPPPERDIDKRSTASRRHQPTISRIRE